MKEVATSRKVEQKTGLGLATFLSHCYQNPDRPGPRPDAGACCIAPGRSYEGGNYRGEVLLLSRGASPAAPRSPVLKELLVAVQDLDPVLPARLDAQLGDCVAQYLF